MSSLLILIWLFNEIYLSNFLIIMIYCMMYFKLKGLFSNIQYFYYDKLSFYLLQLTLILFLMSFNFISHKINNYNKHKLFLILLFKALIYSFLSNSFFFFFFFFEISMLPMVVLILGWGNQPERLYAMSYMFLYTFMGSLPLLYKMFLIWSFKYSTIYSLLLELNLNYSFLIYLFFNSLNLIFNLMWISGFMMKLPVFGVHLWLPKAHVEASTMCSMVLAGILLKLGVYGLLRLEFILKYKNKYINFFFFFWVLIGMIYLNLMCYRNHDLKMMVAYSSVIHMSFLYLSSFNMSMLSYMGINLINMSHGFISLLLFLQIGSLYNISGSRSMLLNNGLTKNLLFLMFLFIGCLLNMSFPPFLSFIGEIFIFYSLFIYWKYLFIFLMLMILMVGMYKMFMVSLMYHGVGTMTNKLFLISFNILMKSFFCLYLSFLLVFMINYYF